MYLTKSLIDLSGRTYSKLKTCIYKGEALELGMGQKLDFGMIHGYMMFPFIK